MGLRRVLITKRIKELKGVRAVREVKEIQGFSSSNSFIETCLLFFCKKETEIVSSWLEFK
jgi:hypothetical protein